MKLKKLRKKGRAAASQVAVLLRTAASLNLVVDKAAGPPTQASAPAPAPQPAPEPAPTPLPPPTKPLDPAGDSTRYKHPYWIREP
jgi:hypothetical protein